jgi:hypothetical protein
VTVLDPQLQLIVDEMKPMLDALAGMRVLLHEGRAKASDLLVLVKKHEAMIRQGRAAILAERGEPFAALLDPLIEQVVQARRDVEEHLQ